jgi:uncharacterized membrane protein HdeD (DUF308 family)
MSILVPGTLLGVALIGAGVLLLVFLRRRREMEE